ncbi:MAG TPA: VOC family protein [Solirubrobacterales bacterium]|nr:VOC family protein [Solirubrobacterales bacterium]
MSRASVTRMGHAAVRVRDLDRSARFAEEVLGMRESDRIDGVSYLTCNERHHELMLVEAEELALDHIAFEVADGDALAEVGGRIEAAGWRLLDEPLEAGIEDAVRCVGPAGFVFELFVGMRLEPEAPFPQARIRPRAIEHATLTVSDLEQMKGFFIDMLGFDGSDEVPGAIAWLRCSGRHHDFNLMAGPDSFHHQAWEVPGLSEIGAVADLIGERGQTMVWGPGRHSPGHVLFGYFADAEGVINEFCADVEPVPSDYQPVIWPDVAATGNRWGAVSPEGFVDMGIPVSRSGRA